MKLQLLFIWHDSVGLSWTTQWVYTFQFILISYKNFLANLIIKSNIHTILHSCSMQEKQMTHSSRIFAIIVYINILSISFTVFCALIHTHKTPNIAIQTFWHIKKCSLHVISWKHSYHFLHHGYIGKQETKQCRRGLIHSNSKVEQ